MHEIINVSSNLQLTSKLPQSISTLYKISPILPAHLCLCTVLWLMSIALCSCVLVYKGKVDNGEGKLPVVI